MSHPRRPVDVGLGSVKAQRGLTVRFQLVLGGKAEYTALQPKFPAEQLIKKLSKWLAVIESYGTV